MTDAPKPEWQWTIRTIVCPDCGPVKVHADVFDRGESISGVCPKCGDRLYFQRPPAEGEG